MNLAYTRRGAGTPLVLLHGIGHHKGAWAPVLDRLATEHDVVALDLPGFGDSPPLPPGMTYSIRAAVDNLRGFFARLGVERPHVAGNSLGGALALELAKAGAARSATLLSPAAFMSPWQRQYALAALGLHKRLSQAPEPLLRRVARSPSLRTALSFMIYGRPGNLTAEGALADMLALRRSISFKTVVRDNADYHFAGEVRVPVTVAWAQRDYILWPMQARVARERLPGARHTTLTGCGHVPMADDPELVANTILATTREAGAAGG
jgi:pimeloyl-ACP methyl ester carboxylesterase